MAEKENGTVPELSMEGLFAKDASVNRPQTLKEFVEQIFSPDNHRQKTILTRKQVLKLTRLMLFAERYQSVISFNLEKFISEYLVSLDARGRDDLKEALKAYVRGEMQEQDNVRQQRSLLQKVLGR